MSMKRDSIVSSLGRKPHAFFDCLLPRALFEQQLFDLRSNLVIIGLDGAFERGYRLPRFVEKIFVKVPARRR
jgi:hypothetical protein